MPPSWRRCASTPAPSCAPDTDFGVVVGLRAGLQPTPCPMRWQLMPQASTASEYDTRQVHIGWRLG
jgi:hypothetical protein